MIERLAEHNPQHAEQLYAVLSTAAGQRAAIAARKDRLHAAGRGDSQLVPGQQDGPEAAAFTTLDSYLHDAAAVQERERIAGQLLDNVIRRVSTLGLTLAGAAGLTMAPEARKRIEEAADGLDDVIRAIRGVVFNQQYPMS
jgi:signal transduction histidine kinase